MLLLYSAAVLVVRSVGPGGGLRWRPRLFAVEIARTQFAILGWLSRPAGHLGTGKCSALGQCTGDPGLEVAVLPHSAATTPDAGL